MRFARLSAAIVLAASLAVLPLRAQTPAPPPQHPTSTPYTGDLGIFEEPDRDKKLQIDRVMDLLGIKPGKVVADIGAGGGWFSVRAARRVAPNGYVIAEDINPPAAGSAREAGERAAAAGHAR